MEVRVSGFVYYECFDPYATEYSREANLPEPETRKVGKGRQFRYQVSEELAADMLQHAQHFGEAMSFGVDDPSVGRRVLAWVKREETRLGITTRAD